MALTTGLLGCEKGAKNRPLDAKGGGGVGVVGEHTSAVPATKYEGKLELFIFYRVQDSEVAQGPPQARAWIVPLEGPARGT